MLTTDTAQGGVYAFEGPAFDRGEEGFPMAFRRAEEEDDEPGHSHKEERPPLWPWILAGLIIAGSVGYILWQIFAPQPDVTTDDAYVEAHYATIAPRVSGQIASVEVENTQIVKKGDLLATIDDRDYRVSLMAEQAQLKHDEAQVLNAKASIEQQDHVIEQSKADISSTTAQLAYAKLDANRYDTLATTGAGTIKSKQQADTTLSTSTASVRSAEARLAAAQQQLAMDKAQLAAAEASVKLDGAHVDQAELNLSYTRILAPVDGMVGERSVQVGNYVNAGSSLMAVVPLTEIYVAANYREVQLQHVEPGQQVRIHVDAYKIDLNGKVVGVPAASGTAFAPIQTDNATGNFTKIVQRLPVRIAITPGQPLAHLLRVGLSVETTIETHFADVASKAVRQAGEQGSIATASR